MSVDDLMVGLPAPGPLRLSGAALFLDLDGTLAPIAARPQDVRPDPRRSRLMARLGRQLEGRLAVVSGRTLADIDRILEGQVASVAAVHGLVRRQADGAVAAAQPHPALPAAIGGFNAFASLDPGLLVEDKGLSVALHYRLAPAYAERARLCAQDLAAATGLALQHGDMVEELRTPGPNKGDSLRDFLGQAPFLGARPIFLGDDATDEHAFQAAHDLGGMGILVGPLRSTGAQFALAGVEETLAWLEAAA